VPVTGASPVAVDAGAVSLGPTGRGARGVSERATHLRGAARDRADAGAPRAATGNPAPGGVASAHSGLPYALDPPRRACRVEPRRTAGARRAACEGVATRADPSS